VKGKLLTALVQGPDQKGIIARITNFIYQNGGNIVYLDQHTDTTEGMFFMRVQFSLDEFTIPRERIEPAFRTVCNELNMDYRLFFSDQKRRVAIMVSKEGHCLVDLLYRWESGFLDIELPAVISNHETLREVAEYYGVPYHYFPVTRETRERYEPEILALLRSLDVDTVVLARYMQILSPRFVDAYRNAIINIHHSFLPAFVGADPYRQAFHRGVKIIGATSHYVTEELDQGPIIAQDVIQVSHRDTLEDFKRKGQDIEKLVLARAVSLHVENRVLVYNGKTVVFGD
jgi:formyltetrahydrofolate deformylase